MDKPALAWACGWLRIDAGTSWLRIRNNIGFDLRLRGSEELASLARVVRICLVKSERGLAASHQRTFRGQTLTLDTNNKSATCHLTLDPGGYVIAPDVTVLEDLQDWLAAVSGEKPCKTPPNGRVTTVPGGAAIRIDGRALHLSAREADLLAAAMYAAAAQADNPHDTLYRPADGQGSVALGCSADNRFFVYVVGSSFHTDLSRSDLVLLAQELKTQTRRFL